jgi:Ser/Thr protein kinase RdoA (MazF antagonist)
MSRCKKFSMREYPPEVLADLEAMVTRALPRWGASADARVSLLNVSENATFAVSDAARGRELIVRVHRTGYSSLPEIRSELQWILALRAEAVVETPLPVAGSDGELVQLLPSLTGRSARHVVAFDRLPGKEPQAQRDVALWFEKLGGITARMHAHARRWTLPRGFCRKRWDVDDMVGPHAHWGPWRAAIGLREAQADCIEQALSRIRARLDRFGRDARQFGLVHADLRLANLLVDGSSLRVIDFDDCGFSWFLYDFAAAISFIEHHPFIPELLARWLEGYRAVASVAPEEAAEIPTLVVLRRILLTAWVASRNELAFTQSLGEAFTAGTVQLAQEFLDGRFHGRGLQGDGGFAQRR